MPKTFCQTKKNETDKNWKTIWNNVLFWVLRLYAKFQATRSKNDKQSAQRKISIICRFNKSRFLNKK